MGRGNKNFQHPISQSGCVSSNAWSMCNPIQTQRLSQEGIWASSEHPNPWKAPPHGLSQQGVWVPFWTPKPLQRTPQDTQIFVCGISKNLNLKLIIESFHLLIIPMTLFNDVMPYFDEFVHVYGWNISILWSPLKIWTPKNFTIANFRHPISKSWLRHCPPPPPPSCKEFLKMKISSTY